MKYAGLIENDFSAGKGVCTTFFTQGCPHKCLGCHNPESWDFNGGKEFTPEVLDQIVKALTANNIQRNFAVMGGEPLCEQNAFLTYMLVKEVKEKVPEAKVYIWTGYCYEELLNYCIHEKIPLILELADYLIDGPFIQEKRDITLKMRGSSNQRIWDLKNKVDITEKI